MKLLTKMHLLEALKAAGVPHTYKTLIRYEKAGIIPQSTTSIEYEIGPRRRLYTEDEIKEIVAKVVEYRRGGKNGQV